MMGCDLLSIKFKFVTYLCAIHVVLCTKKIFMYLNGKKIAFSRLLEKKKKNNLLLFFANQRLTAFALCNCTSTSTYGILTVSFLFLFMFAFLSLQTSHNIM